MRSECNALSKSLTSFIPLNGLAKFLEIHSKNCDLNKHLGLFSGFFSVSLSTLGGEDDEDSASSTI